MSYQHHTYDNTLSITAFINNFLLLLATLILFALATITALIGLTAQAGFTLGLTGTAAVGLLPDETIPDPCQTIYNCKPAEAVLMERGYIIEK